MSTLLQAAKADSNELVPNGFIVSSDGTESPLYRSVLTITYDDQDPKEKAKAEADARLIVEATRLTSLKA